MRSFVLRIIVIEWYSVGACPLEEASEHHFLSIKILLWCCGFIYCFFPLLFSAIFMFLDIIIDLVPYIMLINPFLCLYVGFRTKVIFVAFI
jgi:hypothetical protein